MAKYTKRAQVLLTKDQYDLLEVRAKYEHRAIGDIIRTAIEREIISKEKRKQKKKAVQELLSGKYDLGIDFDHVGWKAEYSETKAQQALGKPKEKK